MNNEALLTELRAEVDKLTRACDIETEERDAAEESNCELRVKVEQLKEALREIQYYGNHSGVIPCPQDYKFYVKHMQEIAEKAISTIDARIVVGCPECVIELRKKLAKARESVETAIPLATNSTCRQILREALTVIDAMEDSR